MTIKPNKNIIVSSESPNLYTTKRLLLEATKQNHQNCWINPYNFLISKQTTPIVNLEQSNLYFHRTTGIRYDDFDMVVAQLHHNFGHKVTNPLNSLELFRNKDKQALFFIEKSLPCIETVSYRGELTDINWNIITELSAHQKFIIKMIRGNQGIGVNLVNGLQSLKSFLETFQALKDQKFIIQPFIEHTKEWRVFILKKEIMAIVERTLSREDFRGNSKRSVGKNIKKLPNEIQNEVLRAASASGLDYCGIDIIEDGDNFYFLEINPVPGFEQLEEISGLNIAGELIAKL